MSFVIGITTDQGSIIASDGKGQKDGKELSDIKKVKCKNNILIGYTGTKEICEKFLSFLDESDYFSAETVYTKLSEIVKYHNQRSKNNYVTTFLIIGKKDNIYHHFMISSLTNQFITQKYNGGRLVSYLYSNQELFDKYENVVEKAKQKYFTSEQKRAKYIITHVAKFDSTVNKQFFYEPH